MRKQSFEEVGKTSMEFVDSSPKERALMLDDTSWSRDMNWELIREISSYMSTYKISAGGTLFHEHAPEAYLCVIVEGKVNIMKEDSKKTKKVIHSIGKGKVLGELSLLDGFSRSATVVAAKDTVVLIFTQNRLSEVMDDAPKSASQFILNIARDLSRRLRKTSGMLVDIMNE